VLGVLFINYGVVGFQPQPVAWRYAGALAFVVVWALGKANEYATGVGPARADYIAAAGGVFVATQLTFLHRILFARWATPYRLEGIWVVIVGLGLLGVAFAGRTPTLVGWAVVVCGVGAAHFALGYQRWSFETFVPSGQDLGPPQSIVIVGLGLALTVGGLLTFARERRHL